MNRVVSILASGMLIGSVSAVAAPSGRMVTARSRIGDLPVRSSSEFRGHGFVRFRLRNFDCDTGI